MKNKCIFCQIARHEIASNIIYENKDLIAFYDINPRAKVHALIIPKKHIASLDDVGEKDEELMGNLIFSVKDIAQKLNLTKGYRLISNTGKDAGQIVRHLHFHLLGGEPLGPMA